ncbi:hypothetical protein QZH41_009416, partial [Actinostola sp. cb2023]
LAFKSPLQPSVQKPSSHPPTKTTDPPSVPPSPVPELSVSLKKIPSEDLMMLNDFFNHAAAFKAQQMKAHSGPTKRQVHVSQHEENQKEKFKENASADRNVVKENAANIMALNKERKHRQKEEKDDNKNAYAKELLEFQRKAIEAEEKRLDDDIIISAKRRHHNDWKEHLHELDHKNQEKESHINGLFDKLSKEWNHHKTLSGQGDINSQKIATQSNEDKDGKDNMKTTSGQDDISSQKIATKSNKDKDGEDNMKTTSGQDDITSQKIATKSNEDKDGEDNMKTTSGQDDISSQKITTKSNKDKDGEDNMHNFNKGIKRRRRKMVHPGEPDNEPQTDGGSAQSDEIMEMAFYDKDQPTSKVTTNKRHSKDGFESDRQDDINNGQDVEVVLSESGKHSSESKWNTPTRSSIQDDNKKLGIDSKLRVLAGEHPPQDKIDEATDKQVNARKNKDAKVDNDDVEDDVETTVGHDDIVAPNAENGEKNPGFGNGKPDEKKVNTNKNKTVINYNLDGLKHDVNIKDDIDEDDTNDDEHNNKDSGSGSNSMKDNEEEIPHDDRLLYILTGDAEQVAKSHTQKGIPNSNKEQERNKQQKLLEMKKQENRRKIDELVDKITLDDNPNQVIFPKGILNSDLKSKLKAMEVRVLDAHQKVSKELEEIEKHLTEKYDSLQESITRAKSLTKDMDNKINDTVLHVLKLAKMSADKAKSKLTLVQKAASALTDIEKRIGANDTRNIAKVIKSRIAELPVSKYESYRRILAVNKIIAKMDGAKIIAESNANKTYSNRDEIEKNMTETATKVLRELSSTEKELDDDTKVEMEDEREAGRRIEDAERRNYMVALKSGETLKKIEGYLDQLEKEEMQLRSLKP